MTESIHRDIGRLEAKVDRLLRDAESAAAADADTARRLAAIERQQEATAGAVSSLAPRVAKGEQASASLEKLSTMGKGYLAGVSVMSALGGSAVVMALHDKIAALWKAAP